MKYIPLESLQNKYPSISNYRKRDNGVNIQGVYIENSLDIPTSNFDSLGVVDGTTFKFIVQVYDNNISNSLLTTFTSELIYNNLRKAKNSANPYYINSVLNPNTFSKVYLDDIKKFFDKQVELEKKFNVTVNYNVIFDGNGTVDFERFGKYIDWIVSKPELEDIDLNGVLPSEEISSFTRGEFGNLAEDKQENVNNDKSNLDNLILSGNPNNNSSGITFGEQIGSSNIPPLGLPDTEINSPFRRLFGRFTNRQR